ncbi:hypothetical protein [Desulfovibrio psychrotolerans]|uniref:Tail fiber protein n=1 Tax=Desulfovibrio psychrotolerans TaxID=415242 RepID=A0A7J0BXV8_9BACT|nr:hypothetical protein [Desulfovibrio psychrotolerans]GFM38011.1 hypothetical protein DSM19430T_26950 [Desulfovibrio psychrotolerans]
MPLNEGAVNDILSFAHEGLESSGDLLPLAEYATDNMRLRGHQPGIARRDLANRVARQAALVAAGVAQFIANRYPAGVLDNGDLDAIEAGLLAAVNSVLSGHAERNDNPHGVTAAQVGAADEDHFHITEEIVDLLPTSHQWLAGQRYPVSTLVAVDAAVTWDMAANPVAQITLTDAVTTVTLTNAQPGATYELTVRQDATGGRSIAFPASVLWPGGTALEVTQDANAEDLVMFSVRASIGSPVIRGFAALNMQVVA